MNSRRCKKQACHFPAGRGRWFPGSPARPIRSWCPDQEVGQPGRIASSRAPVNHEVGRKGIGLPDGRDLHAGGGLTEATIAQAVAARFTEAEASTIERRPHGAVLEPELVLVVAVPVDLGVDIVAVQALGARVEVVGGFPSSRNIGGGNQVQQRHRGAVQAGSGNDVELPTAGEYRAACTIQVARKGIEDHSFLKWY